MIKKDFELLETILFVPEQGQLFHDNIAPKPN
jgi:hypothetical protein